MSVNSTDDEKQWAKYLVKCDKCGHTFLPWKCLAITNEETNWRTHIFCPQCKNLFDRDSSFVN